jgi:phasin
MTSEDAMSTNSPNFEVPPDMRAFAEKSVAQAKQAFDGFITAARQTTATMETTATNAQSGAKDVAQLAMRCAERNIASSFELAEKLVRAKDPQEVMALHSNYVKQQMSTLTEQARELSQKTAGMAAAGKH